ncbi:hypothetical protein K435DRAFT_848044 [Dendrothele bispora CBS 962.96]|uniref:Uncharacterized protein n=1 Tax=Dendrothele bispora (strain CBS 962.96) TaxID=1314807 RepID=A0A4S8MWC8_DENBC|nr:hypothetical protein K435DRAFT_848044 [Dendrothele bispora CBS 962.96]
MSVASWWKPFKKQKQPALTIQDPPTLPSSPSSPCYPNRPPSKSVSSAADSIEPKTPNDTQSRRQSLLTLSDSDPFAAHRPSHLEPDYVPKQPPQRVSYASASSHASDSLSIPDRPTKSSVIRDRLSQPDLPAPRPQMRARGLTDAGTPPPQTKFLNDSNTSSPRVVIRQPSVQRMGLPLSAPPSAKLPPPPPPPPGDNGDLAIDFPSNNRLSYGSTRSAKDRDSRIQSQQYIPRSKPPEPTLLDNPPTSRTLKKAISHQSLSQKSASSTSSTVIPPPLPDDSKAPRKQRSFHHPRFPLPPLPLNLRPNNNTNDTPSISRRGSSTDPPTPGRKRLFSGSSLRRPSTAQSLKDREEDSDFRSIFSLPIEDPKPASNNNNNITTSSFWDEQQVERPVDLLASPRPSTADYTPQQIISPSEMLVIEAKVQESRQGGRERNMSITSASTMASTNESDFGMHLANGFGNLSIAQSIMGGGGVEPSSSSLGRHNSVISTASSSMSRTGVGGGGIVSPKLPNSPNSSARLSIGSAISPRSSHPHSRPTTASTTASNSSFSATSPPTAAAANPSCPPGPPPADAQGIISLSPPPRPRRTPTTSSAHSGTGAITPKSSGSSSPQVNSNSINGIRVSIATGPVNVRNGLNGSGTEAGSAGLSGSVGRRSRSGSLTAQQGQQGGDNDMGLVSLNPPPRVRVVSKKRGNDVASRRKSLMRKPSFLEIDMDDDDDGEEEFKDGDDEVEGNDGRKEPVLDHINRMYAHAESLEQDHPSDLGLGLDLDLETFRKRKGSRLEVQVRSTRERSLSNSGSGSGSRSRPREGHSRSRDASRDGERPHENMEVTVSRVPSIPSHGLVSVKPLNLGSKRDGGVVRVQPRRDLPPVTKPLKLHRQESFLDLARESLDTVRSDSDEYDRN